MTIEEKKQASYISISESFRCRPVMKEISNRMKADDSGT